MAENDVNVKGLFLYPNQIEAFEALPGEAVKQLVIGAFAYMNDKPVKFSDPLADAFFKVICPALDFHKKQQANGSKGGRPKTQKKPNENPNETQAEPNTKPNKNLESRINNIYNTPLRGVVDSEADDGSLAETASEETAVEAQKPSGPPPCPHQQIIDAYHEILPELPRIRSWTNTRSKHLAARWKERLAAGKYETAAEGIAYWRRLFEYIHGQCPWLMGQRTGRDGRAFYASLGWLVQPENFAKVIEGKYVEREGGEA